MRTFILITIICLTSNYLQSQTIIYGILTDQDNNPLVGANVAIKGSYDGAVTKEDGSYKLKTKQSGTRTLTASYIGYSEFSKELNLQGGTIEQTIQLSEKANELNSVICQAGAFGASDSKKAVRLNSIDILTTASSVGDIYGALKSMPGTATVGEDGGMFVRGGEGYETKTFMDGMLVHKPFTSKMPDLPSRGRFMPMMFSGTMFSTGGYSAEYGQAMSSALILTSNGLATEPLTSINILPFGGGINKTFLHNKSSLSVSGDFYNLTPYNSLVKQDIDWDKNPQTFSSSAMYRQQLENGALVKSYTNFAGSKSSLWRGDVDNPSQNQHISLGNEDVYSNTTIFGKIFSDWDYKAGVAYTYDNEDISLNEKLIGSKENDFQIKSVISGNVTEKAKLKTGIEVSLKDYIFTYNAQYQNIDFNANFKNYLPAAFAETDYLFSKVFSARVGARMEFSSLTEKVEVSPRLSLAAQTGKFSQISFATGVFYQSPEDEYLRFNNKLNNEKATHFILNYQFLKDNSTFRIEGYYKDYSKLVKFDSLNAPNAQSYNNNGSGFARGFDVFYRMNKGISKYDFWVSYSFLDTKRNYQNYTEAARPSYFPKHTFTIAYKKMIEPLATLMGFTFITSSARNFHNPNLPGFMNDNTDAYKDLSFSASYITKIMRQETVVHFSISNLLGFDNTFGYNFSSTPDNNGQYRALPIKPAAKRFILLGVFISIK